MNNDIVKKVNYFDYDNPVVRMTNITTNEYTVTTNSIILVSQYSDVSQNIYGSLSVNNKQLIPTAGNNVSGNNAVFICRAGDKVKFNYSGGASASYLRVILSEVPIIS